MWDSLDESGDITTFTTSAGANILDKDNPQCGWANGTDSVYKDALSGYLTIDVVNYCTNFFPDQADFYDEDAIATVGWGATYTPNVLIGDVFYVDTAANGGNISGDPAVAIEFDSRLPFTATTKTFFGKFVASTTPAQCVDRDHARPAAARPSSPVTLPTFQFAGDGREPLGDHYGFRYLADSASGLQSWITVWRSDWYRRHAGQPLRVGEPRFRHQGAAGAGFYDAIHQVGILDLRQRREPLRRRRHPARPVRSAARHARRARTSSSSRSASTSLAATRLEPGRLQVRLGRPHAPRTRPHGRRGAHRPLQHGLGRRSAHRPRRVHQRRPRGCRTSTTSSSARRPSVRASATQN